MKWVIDKQDGAERVKFILSQYIGAKAFIEPQNKEKVAPFVKCPAWVWGDWCNQIETWVNLLPTDYKDIIERHYINGETLEDIAQEEGVSVSHLKNKIHIACMMLHEKGFMSESDIFFDDDELARG